MTLTNAGDSHLDGPVLIIGTGLLGASIGLGLRARGIDTVLSDISPSTQAVAEDIGAGRALSAVTESFEPQLVVVAAPPDVTASVAARALADYPRAVVVDIASVKSAVLDQLRDGGHDLSRYVGTHPMAGREKSGPVAARGELFLGMPWVICPAEETSPAAVKAARSLAVDLGGVVTMMSADEHDRAVALVSHLPQVIATLAAGRLQDSPEHALSLAGNGLRDVTRIAASDPGLWVQILGANGERLADILHDVRADLDVLISALETPTASGARLNLARLLDAGNSGRGRIPGKHGAPPQAFDRLTVLVDDRPGQIARLLTEVGEIGVNLEDLRLEHSPGQPVGLAELSILPGKRQMLTDSLTSRGWKVVQ